MSLPKRVKIFEVGPRDGLQNEPAPLDTATKVELIEQLAAAGVHAIESGSFVSPKWVPQMAGSEAVFGTLTRQSGVTYSALTPNMRGLERAISAGVTEVAVFIAASESFSQKNTNCSIAEAIDRAKPIIERAKDLKLPVRGYVSTVMACPYEGDDINPLRVAELSKTLIDLGCYEVSLGDTIGRGTPGKTKRLIEACADSVGIDRLAAHFHNTYGQALANLLAALDQGVSVIDSSVAGLGGCPYAKGATGNVATEDVLFMLNGMDIETGIDMDKLVDTAVFISKAIDVTMDSNTANAISRTRE